MQKKEPISLDAYNTMAEYYFTHIDRNPFNAYYERPATLSLLPEVQGKRVLDAGCAAGWYTKWFLDHGASVMALDFSPNMVERTKRRVGDKAEIRQVDLNQPLDFLADQSFDLVVSSLVLHYLEDWTGVMNEFHRILRPAGTLVFSIHHPFMDFTYFQRENYFLTELLDDTWETHQGPVNVQFYRRPLNQIISSVLSAGLRLDQVLEPMPIQELQDIAPKVYERLVRKPQFLFIRARKESK